MVDYQHNGPRRSVLRTGVLGAALAALVTVVVWLVATPQGLVHGVLSFPGLLFTWMFILGDNATSSEHLASVARPYGVVLNGVLGFIAGIVWAGAVRAWDWWGRRPPEGALDK